MELIKSIKLAAVFLLLLIMMPPCCLSRGVPKMDPEVYVIDYRGPETHSYIPPPNRSAAGGGGRPHIHHRNFVLHRKSKGGPAKGKNHR